MIEIIDGVFVHTEDIQCIEVKYHETPKAHHRVEFQTVWGSFFSEHEQKSFADDRAKEVAKLAAR